VRRWCELRCVASGYGVSVRIAPERYPVCGGSVWEHAPPLERMS
jgi:hypothetical protein